MSNADEDAVREIELRFTRPGADADGMVESLTDNAQFVTANRSMD